MAGGAAGLGAAAMLPSASAFRIQSDQGLSYYNSNSSKQFNVSPDGVLDVNQIGTDKNPVESVYSKTTNTDELSVTDDSIEAVGTNGNFTETYPIADYADIFAAVDRAITDLPPSGGVIRGPSGTFTTRNQLVVDKPVSLFPDASYAPASNTAAEGSSTVIEWTGGTTTPIVLRPTADTPSRQGGNVLVEGVELGNFLLRPQTAGNGNQAILIDGSAPDDWVRNCRLSCTVTDWGGTSPVVEALGNVFGMYFVGFGAFGNTGDAIASDGATAQSEFNFIRCQLHSSESGSWAYNGNNNNVCFLGGRIQAAASGAHGIRVRGAINISGTKFEGGNSQGDIGIQIYGSSQASNVLPTMVNDWNIGLQLGDGSGKQTKNCTVNGHFTNNSTADVRILDGGGRAGVNIVPRGLTVDDQHGGVIRRAVLQQVTVDERQVAVDTTGNKTITSYPGSIVWDEGDVSVVDASVTDFQLAEPFTQETDLDGSTGIDWVIPVTSASSTAGATATLQITYRNYLHEYRPNEVP